ncbi:MAG: GDYXXLXY domain-containing protein [Spirochaetes bacterium]|nr:GDYXXLXY domain-containing protein [Spirochaetota bacterium]
MNSNLRTAVFIIISAVQISVIAGIIIGHESTVSAGKEYRFPTAPVDPYDIFQGRYLALGFRGLSQTTAKTNQFTEKQSVYALITEDSNGFALITNISATKTTAPCIRVKVQSAYQNRVTVAFPFDHYYLPEDSAKPAEMIYRDFTAQRRLDVYALVAVDASGNAILKDVYVKGEPILSFVKKHRNEYTNKKPW